MLSSWDAIAQQANQTSTPGNIDLSPQYDANGYMNQFAYDPGQNPYSGIIAQGSQMAGQDARAAMNPQSQVNSLNQSYMQYLANSYPSFPNSAGAGNQQAGEAPPPQVPGTGVQGNGVQSQPVYASQSFNPWSLQGEAMSRVK